MPEQEKGKKKLKMAEAVEEMELISLAIRKLIEENNDRAASNRSSGADADDLQLLSRLLSQVESTREEQRRRLKNSQELSDQQEDEKITETDSSETKSENVESRVKVEEEIVKELKEVKRQNFITHCLVTAMIILTVAWQVSEVSLILKLRDGLSNPFKSLARFLKRKTTSAIQQQIEATELPHLNMPPLPHVTLPDFDLDGK